MEDTNFEGNFLKSHNENLNLFKELYSEYTLLKDKLNQLNINPNTLEATSEKKFGILNLSKLNEEAIFDAINFFKKECPYCRTNLYDGNIRKKIEIDHFYPVSKGGQDFPWNLLPICKDCNRKKRDKLPSDFLEHSTFLECSSYLENVLRKLTNNHEDRLQRDEIVNILLTNFSLKKVTQEDFFEEIFRLYKINYESKKPKELKNEKEIDDLFKIIVDNRDKLFGKRTPYQTTVAKLAISLFTKPSNSQIEIVKGTLKKYFIECRVGINKSLYSAKQCLDRANEYNSKFDNLA